MPRYRGYDIYSTHLPSSEIDASSNLEPPVRSEVTNGEETRYVL